MIKNQYFKSFLDFKHCIKTINFNYFNILSINIRSVSSVEKFNQFKTFLAGFPKLPDIIAIQETWFRNDLTQLYSIPGFLNVHCCRQDGYGGTSVYIKQNLHYSVDVSKSECFLELITITLNNFKINFKPLKIISFYRSQKCDVNDFIGMLDVLLNEHARNPIVVLGDANIDVFQNPHYNELRAMFQNYDCDNCHSLVTRPVSGTCIDHVFSNFSGRIYVDSVECALSDHNIICCRFKSNLVCSDHMEVSKMYCDYSKARDILSNNLPIDYAVLNASELTNTLVNCMESAMNSSTIVSKSKKHLRFEIAPWINKNLQELILWKEKLLRKRRRVKERRSVNDILKRVSKIIKIAIKECRENYYLDNLEKIGDDPKKCWRFINNTLGRTKRNNVVLNDSQGLSICSDEIKVNCFNDYFLSSVLTLKRQIEIQPGDTVNSLRSLSQSNHRFKFDNIGLNDVIKVIREMEGNKCPGYDRISPRFIKECAEEVAPVLLEIFNKMISNAIYPDALKVHKVVPIPKQSNAVSLDKYRPISVLSSVDKIFEKILFEKLLFYLEENNMLYECQFGFRRGCGTEEAVLNVLQYVCKGLDDGFFGVAGIFFDFTKAFDLVDHKILIQKLSYYGIQGKELLLFENYFSNRKQYVILNDVRSNMGDVEYGVPQGSGLGPLLFSIYLNDMSNLDLSGKLFMFADDVCLFYPYKHDLVLRTQMERDVALIFEFARLNRLLLNPNKTKVVRFRPHPSSHNDNFSVSVDGKFVREEHSVKYLGVTLQNNLSWDIHIGEIKKKIAPAIGILYKLKYKLNEKSKLMIFQSLVQSHLKYLAVAYACNKNSGSLRSLQCMQNKALKTIYNLPLTYPTLLLYRDVGKTILPIYGLHEYQVVMFVFKCINGIGHHTISFFQNQNNFNTRNRTNLRVPRCRLEKTKQRIDYEGGIKYNNLPSALKSVNRISTFKTAYKRYLCNSFETLLT